MPPDISLPLTVEKCLSQLGLTHLSEWDVLTFLGRHGKSLANAEQISRLLGYSKVTVANALNRLEYEGLVQRSRSSQGARYYELAVGMDSARTSCVQRLMGPAEKRTVRLILARKLLEKSEAVPRERPSRPPRYP